MQINRRTFLSRSAQLGGLLAVVPDVEQAAGNVSVRVTLDPSRTGDVIRPDFIGLGYEISSVARPGVLSASNHKYVQLVRNLGSRGVIRVGGNTSDYSSFSESGPVSPAPKATAINSEGLKDLGTFLEATGWDLIWGLNLGRGSEADAVAEAKAVSKYAGRKLLAFEIGNEPDLFGHNSTHRAVGYDYPKYLEEYLRYKAAIRRELPDAPFAGPDAAVATDWVKRFASDEGRNLKLLTHHYYRECTGPAATLDKLLHPDPKLKPMLDNLRAATASSGVPYRICETNSFCGGGKPGVSDTLGAALWALDFMFRLAAGGAAGINLQTGVNHLGFVSSYSPINDDDPKMCYAEPDYYGMLAFAQASKGRLIAVNCDSASVNLTAYAVSGAGGSLSVTLINKDASQDAEVIFAAGQLRQGSTVLRLAGPSLGSKEGVTLGGAAVTEDGAWKATGVEHLGSAMKGEYRVRVPAATAAIIQSKGA